MKSGYQVFKDNKPYNEYRIDLKFENEILAESINWYSNRSIKKELEKQLSQVVNREFCYLTDSGRAAILTALNLIHVEGKKVAIPSLTHYSILDCVISAKAEPVFIDSDIYHLNITLKNVEKRIQGVRAILIPHMFSLASPDLPAIVTLCRNRGIAIIEDISQIFGDEGNYGRFGDFVALSMSPYKPVSAPFGSAGALFWNGNSIFSEKVKAHIRKRHMVHLLVKLRHLSETIAGLKKINKLYRQELHGLKNIFIPKLGEAAQEFVILTEKKMELESYLLASGLPIERPYQPLHLKVGKTKKICPHTNFYAKQAVHLPIFPDMTRFECLRITDAVKKFFVAK